MIPIITDLLSQPGVMVGMGLGLCIGFFARGSLSQDNGTEDVGNSEDDAEEDGWDEDGFLAAGSGEQKLVLIVRSDLKMGKGKAAAQNSLEEGGGSEDDDRTDQLPSITAGERVRRQNCCSHATLKAYKQLQQKNKTLLRAWEMNGQPKVVVKTEDEESLLDLAALGREAGLTVSLIQDAGRTQIAPGSRTVLALGPGPVCLLDQITGHLKLY